MIRFGEHAGWICCGCWGCASQGSGGGGTSRKIHPTGMGDLLWGGGFEASATESVGSNLDSSEGIKQKEADYSP